jgi:hypothetical protein
VNREVRPMLSGKKQVDAPEGRGGVGVQAPMQGMRR